MGRNEKNKNGVYFLKCTMANECHMAASCTNYHLTAALKKKKKKNPEKHSLFAKYFEDFFRAQRVGWGWGASGFIS